MNKLSKNKISLTGANWKDMLLLSLLTILITWHPYYLHQKINLFELGLYLPGIDSILKGDVPYRDFFYLRGPFEIYVPSVFMRLFGENVAVLSTYFYVGTVIALIVCVAIAFELFETRLFLWVFVPVLLARTFTRVVFTYWGGMRYVLGLLVLWCMVRFYKTQRKLFLAFAGALSALALMTSVEIEVCLLPAVIGALGISLIYERKDIRTWVAVMGNYLIGFSLVMGLFLGYMVATHSLIPFVEDVYAVVFKSHPTFATYLTSTAPRTLFQFIKAMFPGTHNFQYMTPMYLYIGMAVYFLMGFKKRTLTWKDFSLIAVSIYGFILYMAAFRIIEGGQFETALQPEKIIFFFYTEKFYLFLKEKFSINKKVVQLFLVVVIVSSIGFSLNKYFHRFFVFKYVSSLFSHKKKDLDGLGGRPVKILTIPRAKGMVTPAEQGEEIEQVVNFVDGHSLPTDRVFAYPDRGAYSFLMDRPYVGRFPTAYLTWMNDKWHQELMGDLAQQKPKFAVVAKDPGKNFWEVYFTSGHNHLYYDDVLGYIQSHYQLVKQTPYSYIYQIKESIIGKGL
jgi:hypothetical protein